MKLLKLSALITCALFLFPVLSYAQDPTIVEQGKELTISFDHSGANTTEYQVLVDNNTTPVAVQPVSVLQNGHASFKIPGLARGNHVLTVIAANPDNTSDPMAMESQVNAKAEYATPDNPTGVKVVNINITVNVN